MEAVYLQLTLGTFFLFILQDDKQIFALGNWKMHWLNGIWEWIMHEVRSLFHAGIMRDVLVGSGSLFVMILMFLHTWYNWALS